ncbi:type III-B CRISPR module RAMP protein Cmr1 [Marinitoga sp. 38H-ov]|uniref:type III-B CRISPR module RAMP protein Cmr1 n=1 Tax=Marinitoga sp. 38H-ov TaxID=1755814 RepID=UPI0013EB2A89|nr:type III-B CRISPR module RAMP protein Cmr1 [Marinitoga sp. 38H-ov]KAF2956642.1 hypothetical protein AS160_04410 [Marinitoga sp. 38H-ov]
MNILEYELTTISPMFASRDGKDFELTSQSIRGVLRFWFRAVIPRVLNIHYYKNTKEDYIGLKKAEEFIFGSTEKKSPFDVIVEGINGEKSRYNKYFSQDNRYGIYGVDKREFLKENSRIKLVFVVKNEKIKGLLENLLILVSLIGGFGAKSRKGFGSFEINKNNYKLIDILKILDEENKKIFSNGEFDLTPTKFDDVSDYPVLVKGYYSSFSKNTKYETFKDVYNYLFKTPQDFNQKGVYIKTKYRLRKKGNDSFKTAIYDVEKGYNNNIIFHQSIFGLPINYKTFNGQHKNLLGSNYSLTPENGERKASPLFISVYKNNNKYSIRFLILKSKLTASKNPRLKFNKKRGNTISVMGNENYNELIEELKNNVKEEKM